MRRGRREVRRQRGRCCRRRDRWRARTATSNVNVERSPRDEHGDKHELRVAVANVGGTRGDDASEFASSAAEPPARAEHGARAAVLLGQGERVECRVVDDVAGGCGHRRRWPSLRRPRAGDRTVGFVGTSYSCGVRGRRTAPRPRYAPTTSAVTASTLKSSCQTLWQYSPGVAHLVDVGEEQERVGERPQEAEHGGDQDLRSDPLSPNSLGEEVLADHALRTGDAPGRRRQSQTLEHGLRVVEGADRRRTRPRQRP